MYYRYIYLLPNAMYLSLVPKIDTWRREGNEICKFIEYLVLEVIFLDSLRLFLHDMIVC